MEMFFELFIVSIMEIVDVPSMFVFVFVFVFVPMPMAMLMLMAVIVVVLLPVAVWIRSVRLQEGMTILPPKPQIELHHIAISVVTHTGTAIVC